MSNKLAEACGAMEHADMVLQVRWTRDGKTQHMQRRVIKALQSKHFKLKHEIRRCFP